MDIINFSKKIQYKILIWSLFGLGILMFGIGIVFAATSGNTTPTSLAIVANSDGAGNYTINVWQKETSFQVTTEPGNKTRTPITLQISSNTGFADVTQSIRSGGFAIITLKEESPGVFFYGRTFDISVSCGTNLGTKTIRVNICVPANQAKIETTLYRVEATEKKVSAISADDYNNGIQYRLNVNFTIWGAQIQEPLRTAFLETDLDPDGLTGIQLFGNDAFIDIPPTMLGEGSFRFALSCKYLGQQYIDYFILNIVD